MKIGNVFKEKHCVFSIECFPPKQADNYTKMQNVLKDMKTLEPDFISVTYGAGGSSGGVSSVDIASFIKNELNIESVAHVLCMGAEKASMELTVKSLIENKIENILALRGDETPFRPRSKDFIHASDLIEFLKSKGDFFISAACYPEGHPESPSLKKDIENLVIKQSVGADHFISQLFFDNQTFYNFLQLSKQSGLTSPVSAGIMPIVKATQIERTVKLSSCSLPARFTKMLSLYQNDPDSLFSAGIDYAIEQIRNLIKNGVCGIHLYAMNNFDVAQKVYNGIKDLL